MGNVNASQNNQSTSNNTAEDKYVSFYDIIMDIATNYILTMDFKSMTMLSDKEYCDNLVILTSDIIARYFNDMEISYLEQKIHNGEQVDALTDEDVIYLNRNNLDELDIQNNNVKSIKKKRACIGIAKYYIKIAHIFAAIVMTINPIYVYKDDFGTLVKKTLLEKADIPLNTSRRVYKINICDNRIKALNQNLQAEESYDGNVVMNPKICEMNLNEINESKNLSDEPGIEELEKLYLDDKYDYKTGIFKGMSSSTKRQYMNDLTTFYRAFTGNSEVPPEIKRFSDIKLKDYNKTKGCNGIDAPFKNPVRINKKDKLYIKYANNIKQMIETASNQQKQLLGVINMLFAYVNDPNTGQRKIRINPTLNNDVLQKAVYLTRQIIVNLYVQCEKDYVEGVKIYQAIVERQIFETTQNQIINLTNEVKENIEPYRTPLPLPPRTVQATSLFQSPSMASSPIPDQILYNSVLEEPSSLPVPENFNSSTQQIQYLNSNISPVPLNQQQQQQQPPIMHGIVINQYRPRTPAAAAAANPYQRQYQQPAANPYQQQYQQPAAAAAANPYPQPQNPQSPYQRQYPQPAAAATNPYPQQYQQPAAAAAANPYPQQYQQPVAAAAANSYPQQYQQPAAAAAANPYPQQYQQPAVVVNPYPQQYQQPAVVVNPYPQQYQQPRAQVVYVNANQKQTTTETPKSSVKPSSAPINEYTSNPFKKPADENTNPVLYRGRRGERQNERNENRKLQQQQYDDANFGPIGPIGPIGE